VVSGGTVKAMTDRLKEQLSAFLDGELPEAETTLLLKRLDRDDELKATLSRYSLIGAVMRADVDTPASRHVAARVRAAIAREPVPGSRPSSRWLRPAAGLAVAAGVAMAAVLLVPQFMTTGTGAPETLAANGSSPIEVVSPIVEQSSQTPEVVPVVTASYEEPAPAYTTPPAAENEPATGLPSAQLASYLLAHSEYTLPLSRRVIVTTVPQQPADAAGAAPQSSGNDAR